MKIAVLITCYNRKESTLRCLASLLEATEQVKVNGEGERWTIGLFLVDDGSTDGTGEAVQGWYDNLSASSAATFNLHLIRGSGSLFWAKGMQLAWRAAAGGDCDGFLWLNDDAFLLPEALSALLHFYTANADSLIVGELQNSRGEIVYGLRGDLFTGNFVFVPRSVFEKIGMICGEFHHAWADSDYAMRCRRSGVPVVSCGVVGTGEGHPNRPSLVGVGLRRRCRMLWDPKGWCIHDLWLYRRRNRGVFAAVASCAHLVGHVLKGER